jgi:hypothetical protein
LASANNPIVRARDPLRDRPVADDLPALCVNGILDCLWQSREGAWHVLLVDTAGSAKSTKGREVRRAFGSVVARQQFGDLLGSARVYCWDSGKYASLRAAPRRLANLAADLARAVVLQTLTIGHPPRLT